MNYEVTLGFKDADEFADLMILLATNKLLGSVRRVGYGLMEQTKPERPTKGPLAVFAGTVDREQAVRPYKRGDQMVSGYDRERKKRRPPQDFRVIMARAKEVGKSGLNRMGTMLAFLSKQGGTSTTPEIIANLLEEGLEPHGNPIIAITTRHLALSDKKGSIVMTTDGAQFLAQLMARRDRA